MIYTLKDGDVVKILPFVEDNLVWIKENIIIYKFGNSKLFEKNNVDKLRINYLKKNVPANRTLKFNIRYYSNALINGELKLISFGWTLKKLIDSDDILNFNSNKHILISIKYVDTPAGNLPSYENCVIVTSDEIKSDSKFIKELKEFDEYYKYVEDNKGNNNDLRDFFGDDLYSNFISEERESKINQIINV